MPPFITVSWSFSNSTVIPAKAGIHPFQPLGCGVSWIPAFAGMTQSCFGSRDLMSLQDLCIP
ncbi:protein of unknown function [Azospirillum lipoferum 4B]|uniref:Uncharacterized protein n=1 Tax=Azospirillum lipoferum (strain 4B) TaxID=862719 RepID=G7Z3E3_AZOL4|nr:protein of unknown function [Azospirillum lipoferum 4B]